MPNQVDWFYGRKHCDSCRKTEDYLAKKKVKVVELTDARQRRFTREEVLRLAKRASRIIASRGRGRVIFDMKDDPPSDDELLKVLIGPTGNLRAPTILKGNTLIVGFHEGAYAETFKRGDGP